MEHAKSNGFAPLIESIMSMSKEKKQSISKRPSLEDRLATVKFNVAQEPHIKLDKTKCKNCEEKTCIKVCPVGNYQENEADASEIIISWEGCMECGTCRIACPHGAIEWNYPVGGKGVCFRFG